MITMTNNLGEWIRIGLDEMGKTQAWLAAQVGVQPPQISRIISGESEATPDVLNKLADALRQPRIQAYRAAGHFQETSADDRWIEEMTYKLNQIPPALRPIASKVIEGFATAEEREQDQSIVRRIKTAKI